MERKLLLSAVAVIFLGSLLAQAPQGIGHQMVIRDAEGKLITGSTIGISVSILQGTAEGNVVYSETHAPMSNINGLVSYVIGQGTAVEGVFADIDWSDGPYFLKTQVDPAGGTAYSIIGTTQFLSVPYALHAKTAETVTGEISESDPVFSASPSFGITGANITNWTTAFGWGNHAGLYKSVSWVPSWTDVTDKPSVFPPSVHSHSAADINSGTFDAARIPTLDIGTKTSGTLSVARGGTGATAYTSGNVLIGNGTGAITTLSRSGIDTRATFPPAIHPHSAADITTGTLAVARGGTGLASYTAGNYIRASGATTLEQLTPAQVRTDIGAGTVSSIATGNGITGGTITTTGTLGLTGQALALHNLGINGIIARTGEGVVAARSIAVSGNGIAVSNGNGVSGNPTVSLHIGTGATQVAAGNHIHGNITSDGKIGSTAGRIVTTGTGGTLAATAGTAAGQMLYWNGSAWINVAPGATGQVLTLDNGTPTWVAIGAVIGSSTDVYNPTTGKFWMDRNLGATQVATSSTDADSYGYLYQWGRLTDGHQIRTSSTTSTLSSSDTPGHGNFILAPNSPYDWRSGQNDNLWQGVNGVNNPCPPGYRLPTAAEWEEERLSWSSNDAAGAFASPLKLPVAGSRIYSSGSLDAVGFHGRYWSSTVDGFTSRYLLFYNTNSAVINFYRANGYSVRCLKD